MYSNIFRTSHGGERARAGALGGLCLRVSSRAIAGVLTVTGRGQRSVAMAATGNGSREVRYMEQTIGAQYAAMTAVPQATVRNVRICDAEDVSIRRTGVTTAVDDPSQFHPSASWLDDAQKCVEDAEAHLQKTHHVAKDDAATGGHKDHTLSFVIDSTESESQGSASSPVPTFDLKMHPAVGRPDYEVSQHDCTPKRLSVKASNFDTDTTGARRSLKTSSSDSEETAAIQSKSPAYSSSGESTVDDAIVEFRRSLMKTSSSESDETRDLLGESTVNAGQAVAQQHNVGSPRVAQQERVELLSSPDVDGELPSRKRQRTCRFIDDHAGASSGSCGSDEIDDDIVDENGYARDSFIASSEDSLEL